MKTVKIDTIKANDANPRTIDENQLNKLKTSIEDFDAMLELRPIVVDENMVVLGGNMRLQALKEAGYEEVPIQVFTKSMAAEMNKQRKKNKLEPKSYEDFCREFIIKDNLSYGEWDFNVLYDEWNVELLTDWGLEIYEPKEQLELDEFFTKPNRGHEEENQKFLIVLDYTEEDYHAIMGAMEGQTETKEQIFFKALGLI